MLWQQVAAWRWKRTRQVRLLGSCLYNSVSMLVRLTGPEKFANLKLTFEACHVWSGTKDSWSQSPRGCHRPPAALLEASSSKRLGSRASAAVGAKAAGGSGASRRPGRVSYATVYVLKHNQRLPSCSVLLWWTCQVMKDRSGLPQEEANSASVFQHKWAAFSRPPE